MKISTCSTLVQTFCSKGNKFPLGHGNVPRATQAPYTWACAFLTCVSNWPRPLELGLNF